MGRTAGARVTSAPSGLRVEHLDGVVLGLTVTQPRLSWRLPDGAGEQHAYEVDLGPGGSKRVESDRSVLAPWPFDALRPRQSVEWRVRVWTDLGVSGWSAPARFELGLLAPEDWVARWVSPHEDGAGAADGGRAPHILRHEFDLAVDSAGARLHATAHGVYETFLNGARVGDLELTPGFTDYDHRLQVQTYDVDDLLVDGMNRWDVVLSHGWFRGRHGTSQRADNYGTTLAFLGQLEAGDVTVATGEGWMSTTGPIRSADLMAGQVEDHRHGLDGWRPMLVVDHDLARLAGSPAPPVRRVEQIRPVAVRRVAPDRQVVDLGQNINGWLRVDDLGPAGTQVLLQHGEALDAEGDVTVEHLSPGDVDLGQRDQVISAGSPGEVFEPRHTVHGFQFARIEGHPHRLTPADVTGVVVHTDLRRTGWFRCSDERINRLHEIADWSFRDNACDIPTDCPQRERSGWTGDWQVFLPSAAFLYDVAGFSVKWLRDLAAQQLPNGLLPNYAPDPRQRNAVAAGDLTWFGMLGSAGWGDACVMVPWELYRLYGDEEVLEELWPTMVRWLDYAATSARTRRHPARAADRPEPAPHEQYLWDGGWHWGEWCEPANPGDEPWYSADQGHVATAFLHHTAALVARIGRMLGHDDQADGFDELAAKARYAWQVEYLGDDGGLVPDTQANHVRALAFGLVPDERRGQTADRLVALIRQADNHLATGFLATPYLLPVLADTGHPDVAYELLFQNTAPSWLAMVDQGATTVWESWEGLAAGNESSLNHYSKGAVISFLHRYVAGVRPLDGGIAYRRFRIEPMPGGGITWAEAVHDSPYGRIESSWRCVDGTFRLTATVPSGTRAEVHLPDGSTIEAGPGTWTYTCDI